jgi:uncharacterized membrane protein
MKRVWGLFLAAGLILGVFGSRPAMAQGLLPAAYDFGAAFTYYGQSIVPESEVSLEITLQNLGLRGDTFDIEITELPPGWTADISRFNTILTGIYLGAEENAALTLQAWPPDGTDIIQPGEYPVAVRIKSRAGQKTVETRTVLRAVSQKKNRQSLAVSTSYPEISGPSDNKFAFSLDIRNNSSDDSLVNLIAETPQDWEGSFKPGYEEKQISSIHVPKGQSRSVTLDINPAYQAEAGVYPVTVKAESPAGTAEISLIINLTGTYSIRTAALNDLLSMSAEAGRPATVNIYVYNDGSAVQKEISFLPIKPDNWQVQFKPEKLNDLPGRSGAVLVEMTVTPAPNALVGDYSLMVNFQGEKASDHKEFRVTVRASSAWTWAGGLVIVAVVAALAWTFRKLGRR